MLSCQCMLCLYSYSMKMQTKIFTHLHPFMSLSYPNVYTSKICVTIVALNNSPLTLNCKHNLHQCWQNAYCFSTNICSDWVYLAYILCVHTFISNYNPSCQCQLRPLKYQLFVSSFWHRMKKTPDINLLRYCNLNADTIHIVFTK